MIDPPPGLNSLDDLVKGCVILVDKPYGWTSYDLVNKVKWFVRNHLPHIPFSGEGKMRIGHAGTLDPLATGLVVLCTGKCTRQISQFQEGKKVYTGTIFIGQVTASYDLETTPEGHFETSHITDDLLLQTAHSFEGEQWQTPPQFSAKQVDGQRAYHAARKGRSLIIPASPVTLFYFRITRIALPEVDFEIACSKGTYIRSVAHDFGQKMGSGSYLKALRRIRSDPFAVETAFQPQELELHLKQLVPPEGA